LWVKFGAIALNYFFHATVDSASAVSQQQ